MASKENCKIGDIVLIKAGRNNKPIAHTEFGKVIIPVNKIKYGYAKIVEIVKVAENYILVKVENVIRDYYDSISYEEFKKVLKFNGFKIGFDRPFEYKHRSEHQLLAYNLSNGIVIVAETYCGSKTFNSIRVYCPNVNGLGKNISMMSQTSSTMTVLDLCYRENFEFPLQWINNLVENKEWDVKDDISLWTYADNLENIEYNLDSKCDNQVFPLWHYTINRILLADSKIEAILGNSLRLKPIFRGRKSSKNYN